MLDMTRPTNAGDQGAQPRAGKPAAPGLGRGGPGSGCRRRFRRLGQFLQPGQGEVAHPAADVAVQVFGLGTVEARVTSKIGFKIAGLLVDLRADVGHRVAKGAVSPGSTTASRRRRSPARRRPSQQAEANLQKANAERAKGAGEL